MLQKDASNKAMNCREADVTEATGGCWMTTFGDWKCTMNGRTGATRTPTAPVK